jgi:hypothetical protein
MLAFGWNFHFGHLDYTFHDGRVVYTVFVRGVRFRFVGGLGAPPSRLATVENGGGGGGNEPTEEGGVPVKAVPPAKGRGSARHSKAGPIEVSLGSSLFALSLSDSRHGPVGVMLAFGCFFLGTLFLPFMMAVLLFLCVCVGCGFDS